MSQERRDKSISQAMPMLPAMPIATVKQAWAIPVASKLKAGKMNFDSMVKMG